MLQEALPPESDLIRLYVKGNMTSTYGTVGWQHPAFSSYVRPKQQQDAWTGADLQGCATTAFEISVGDLPQPENILIESDSTIDVRDVERAF
jgi:hypothetical protein